MRILHAPKFAAFATALVVLASAAPVRAEIANSPEIKKGWVLFAQNRKEEAIAAFRREIERNPGDVWTHRAYQTAMLNFGKYDELKREYRSLLNAHKDKALYYYLFSFIDNDYVEAKKIAEQGLRLDPKDPWLAWYLGWFKAMDLFNEGKEDEALMALDALPLPRQEPVSYHIFRAMVLSIQGRLEKALNEADAAVKEDPFDMQARMFRVGIFYRERREAELLAALDDVDRLGSFASAHGFRATNLWEHGKIPEAKEEFKKVVASPRDINGWDCTVAIAYSYLNEFNKAQEHARLAVRYFPDDYCAQGVLVSYALGDGRFDEAEKDARAILSRNPKSEDGLSALGQVDMWRGRYAEVVELSVQALERDPKNIYFLATLGISRINNGQCAEGKRDLQTAYRFAPDSPDVNRSMGQGSLCRGSYKEAIRHYADVLRVLKDDSSSFEGIGEAQLQLRNYEATQAAFIDAIKFAVTEREKSRLSNRLKSIEFAAGLTDDQRCKDAGKDFQAIHKAYRLAPTSPDANRSMGQASWCQGNYYGAINYYADALRLKKDDSASWEGIGEAQVQIRNYEAAQAAYVNATKYASTERDKRRLSNWLKSIEYTVKSIVDVFPKDGQTEPVELKIVQSMDLNRSIAYEDFSGGASFIGTPWNGRSPIYQAQERSSRNDVPQWSTDGGTLYSVRGDLVALDVAKGQERVVAEKPAGKRRVSRVISKEDMEDVLSSSEKLPKEALAKLKAELERKYVELDKDFEDARLSKDGRSLYYAVNISTTEYAAYRIERVGIDGAGREVLASSGEGVYGFLYDRPLDMFIVSTSSGIALFDPRSKKFRPIGGRSADFYDASFSPDGKSVVFSDWNQGDGELRIVDFENGKIRFLSVRGSDPAWSPDGSRIAYLYSGRELRMLDLKTGKLQSFRSSIQKNWDDPESGAGHYRDKISWSPDSRYVIFSLRYVRDSKTGKAYEHLTALADLNGKSLWFTDKELRNIAWSPAP